MEFLKIEQGINVLDICKNKNQLGANLLKQSARR